MTDRSSDHDQEYNRAKASRRGSANNSRKSSHPRVGKPLHKRVCDADTTFGGKLLDEVRQRLAAKPLPLTKQERARKITTDIQQLLNEFPRAPVKLIIEALAALEPDTDWSTSGREIATVIRQIRSGKDPLGSNESPDTRPRPDRPGATNTNDQRPAATAASGPYAFVPPRPTPNNHSRAVDMTPGLFGPSSNQP